MTNETSNIEITYNNYENKKISSIATAYFKVEGLSPEKVAGIIRLESINYICTNKISNYLYPESDDIVPKVNTRAIKTLISPLLNNWCYIIWNISRYNECKKIVQKLCSESDNKISCFFIDPWIAHHFWIIAERSSIIRECELNDSIEVNIGLPLNLEEETYIKNIVDSENLSVEEWVKNRENPFLSIERVYRELIKQTGQHIEKLNTIMDNSENYICGTINIEEAKT
jgi:hypothetical protein